MAKNRNPFRSDVRGLPYGAKGGSIPMSPERRRLCELLELNQPSDHQLYSDALAEIERIERAIEEKHGHAARESMGESDEWSDKD